MPARPKTSPEERAIQRGLISHVCDTAMHILHESAFFDSDIWPASGFRPNSYGQSIQDCISYGLNPYGWERRPMTGRISFNVWDYKQTRVDEQFEQIKLSLDCAYLNNVLFEDELTNSYITDKLWFKFTYTPSN